jgi:hypothetical protein
VADRWTLPYLTTNQRFGGVFVRLVRMSRLGRTSHVVRLSPAEADRLADALRDCAAGARREPRKRPTLKLRRPAK